MKPTIKQLKPAVTKALGSKILEKGGSGIAHQVFAYLATVECGASTAQVASELGCTMASALNYHMAASQGLANGDADVVEAVSAARNVLLGMIDPEAPLVATAEQADCNHTFTEVEGLHATPAQMLLLSLLAWSLGGSVMGFTKRHYLFPVAPSDERIVDAMRCLNSLSNNPTKEQLNEAISKLFKADYILH